MTLSSPAEGPLVVEPATGAGRKPLSSRLELEFAADADGRTYLRRQYAGYPFHVCRAQFQDDELLELATLYIQSCSGGIYEDDRFSLRLVMSEDAQAHVTTQAATIVHNMPRGFAEQRLRIECGAGSYLEYLPDPQILFPGSTCRSAINVRLAENAVALVSDAFLQHDPAGEGETFDTFLGEVAIEGPDERILSVDRLQIDGRSIKERLPGVFGPFAAQGTLMAAGLGLPESAILNGLRSIDLPRGQAAMGFSRGLAASAAPSMRAKNITASMSPW